MIRNLIVATVIMLGASFAANHAQAEGKAGEMIDQMMNQEALADAASAIITAESALPKKAAEVNSATTENMDKAVKLAMAKIPEAKNEKSEAVPDTRNDAHVDATGEAIKENGALASVTTPAIYNENQQPVFNNDGPAIAKSKKSSSSTSQIWWRMISSLAIVLTVFGGGMYAFKKWPGAKKLNSRGRMIEVLSQHHLGPKRSLAVIRVAGEACLIGVTDQNITILKTLSLLDDDVPALNRESEAVGISKKESKTLSSKFQETLAATFTKSAVKTRGSEVAEKTDAAFYTRAAKVAAASPVPEEDFTMQGLREIVGERLKSMREL